MSRSTIYELDHMGQLPSLVETRGASRARRRWLSTDVIAYIERARMREEAGDDPEALVAATLLERAR